MRGGEGVGGKEDEGAEGWEGFSIFWGEGGGDFWKEGRMVGEVGEDGVVYKY